MGVHGDVHGITRVQKLTDAGAYRTLYGDGVGTAERAVHEIVLIVDDDQSTHALSCLRYYTRVASLHGVADDAVGHAQRDRYVYATASLAVGLQDLHLLRLVGTGLGEDALVGLRDNIPQTRPASGTLARDLAAPRLPRDTASLAGERVRRDVPLMRTALRASLRSPVVRVPSMVTPQTCYLEMRVVPLHGTAAWTPLGELILTRYPLVRTPYT